MVKVSPASHRTHFPATPLWLLLAMAIACLHAPAAAAASTRTQTIALKAGWNAIFLEVQPADSAPEAVFAGVPVQTVAWFRKGGLDAQYIRDPGDAPWRAEGWSVWYAPGQPDAVLTDLHDLRAGYGYLVRASAAATLAVTGTAKVTRLEWQPNNCTFTGLPVDANAGPTVAAFFAGSPAHARLRIFRMENGLWKLVRDPANTRTRAGEAYWIQTDGSSQYQGPMRLNLPSSGDMGFGATGDSFPLEIACTGGTALTAVTLATVGGADALPLLLAVQDPGALTYRRDPLPATLAVGAIAPGAVATLRIEPNRTTMTTTTASTLLKLSDPSGVVYWIPASAGK